MKKKLVCLALSIVMLLSCLLTACSTTTDEEDDETVDNTAKTITMWVMTPNAAELVDEVLGEKKDGETETERIEKTRELMKTAQARVSEEFTEITKSLYKTNVILKFYEEDEYYSALEKSINALADHEDLKAEAEKMLRIYLKIYNGEGTRAELTERFYQQYDRYASLREELEAEEEEDDEEVTEEETEENEYGMTVIKYPDEAANQVDIFYIGGRAKYYEYYEKEWLASLDEELNASSIKLNQYVSPALLNGVRIDGGVYGIPNNVPVGEYTYMLIDKELYDGTYNSGASEVKTVLELSNFLNDVKAIYGDSVVPLASSFEECLKMLTWFWELSYQDASVYDTVLDEETGRAYVVVDSYKAGDTSTYGCLPYSGMKYKTNDDGQFVDYAGNVLDYSYQFDTARGYLRSGRTNAAALKLDNDKIADYSMYLVDGDGNPVTPENDRRVIQYDDEIVTVAGLKDVLDADGSPVKVDGVTIQRADSMSITLSAEEGKEPTVLTLNPGNCTIEFVATGDDDEGLTVVDANGNTKPSYVYFYNDDASFSIVGQPTLDSTQLSRGDINLAFKSLFTDTSFRETYLTLKEYEYNGLYGEPTKDQLAAVSFMTGNSEIILEAERVDEAAGKEAGVYTKDGRDYYVVVAKYPEASEEELYGNMFCVYENSNYVNRSMEVITRINTNSELRNLLQYGILGEHYELNADGTAHLLTDTTDPSKDGAPGVYRMDIEKTGNCFVAAPQEADGPDVWENAKKQNEVALINPLLGFDFNTEMADREDTLDVLLIRELQRLSQEAQEGIDDCATLDDLKDLLTDYKKDYSSSAGNSSLTKALRSDYDPSQPLGPDGGDEQKADLNGQCPYTIYYEWMTNNGYLPS